MTVRRLTKEKIKWQESAGVILGQFCIWISDAALDDLFFFQRFVLLKAV